MSIIINPNAPPPKRTHDLDMILDTMRVIAHYRQLFFKLEATKQNDGVSPPITARQLLQVENEQQALMQDMVSFILYGANKNGGIKSTNENSRPPVANLENNTQGVTKKESADWRTLLTEND